MATKNNKRVNANGGSRSLRALVRRHDVETTISTLKYIAASPDQKYGGFHIHTKETAAAALREIRKLQMAVRWALGEVGDFPMRQEGQGAYWWRTELRRRAGMSSNTKPSGDSPL